MGSSLLPPTKYMAKFKKLAMVQWQLAGKTKNQNQPGAKFQRTVKGLDDETERMQTLSCHPK